MPQPHFEVPLGVVDGVNRTFVTSTPYKPQSTAVFLNGRLHRKLWDDGWAETNPIAGVVDLNEAPWLGDDVQIFYLDTTPVLPGEVVTPLTGTVMEVDGLSGRLFDLDVFNGVVQDTDTLAGTVVDSLQVIGEVDEVEELVAHVEVCECPCNP